VTGRQLREHRCPLSSEGQPDDSPVRGIDASLDQVEGLGSLRKLDGAVVPEKEVVGDVADRRATTVWMTSDGQQQLVLARRKPGGLSLFLAPTKESPEIGAEGEQAPVVIGPDRSSRHAAISSKYVESRSKLSAFKAQPSALRVSHEARHRFTTTNRSTPMNPWASLLVGDFLVRSGCSAANRRGSSGRAGEGRERRRCCRGDIDPATDFGRPRHGSRNASQTHREDVKGIEGQKGAS
jgi:hypothetical protein